MVDSLPFAYQTFQSIPDTKTSRRLDLRPLMAARPDQCGRSTETSSRLGSVQVGMGYDLL